MNDSEHDPFNERDLAHPRARELFAEDFFWDCVDEDAPFGSDEGHDAYFEYRNWRRENPAVPLIDCISWILDDRLDEYTLDLCTDEQIRLDVANPNDAFMADSWDMFTLDATIIATGFGQLIDEGQIDVAAKPFVRVALTRQLHHEVAGSGHRVAIMRAALRVLEDS
jgi:uncharacterized protein YfeS